MEKWSRGVAIVTGANSGVGFGILTRLAKCGITVVGFDIKTYAIEQFKLQNENLKVFSIACELTSDSETETAFSWVEEKFGGVDILVNNAGLFRDIGLLDYEQPMSELSLLVDVNFKAVVRCARLAFKSMEARDVYGYIININSVYGHSLPIMPQDMQVGIYPSTKYAITAATDVMRQELIRLKNRKVRVTSISPGLVNTNLFSAAGIPQETIEAAAADTTFLEPEDIGETIVYLLSVPYHISIHEITIRATGSDI